MVISVIQHRACQPAALQGQRHGGALYCLQRSARPAQNYGDRGMPLGTIAGFRTAEGADF
jgi:hypothetical protein